MTRALSHARAALFVLALGFGASIVAWWYTHEQVTSQAARAIRHDAARAVEALDRQIKDNIDLLLGLKGFFLATEGVSRAEFQRYLSSFRLEGSGEKLRLISFAPYVRHAEKAAFEERVRADTTVDSAGYPKFAVRPPGERDDYVVVEFIEPTAGNVAALGLDLAADPVRRAEIERARDTGEPIASGPFAASVDPSQTSIAVRLAIYRRGSPVETVEQRRAAFDGVVAVVMHVRELVTSSLGRQFGIDFHLTAHDMGPTAGGGATRPEQKLLFDSRGGAGAEAAAQPEQVATLTVGGREWRLAFTPVAAAAGAAQALPLVVFLGGVVTSLLLAWLIWTLTIARERALRLAEQTTAVHAAEGLREQLRFVQQLIESLPQPIFFKDAAGRYLGVNKAWERFFGISRERFIGKTVFELYPGNRQVAQRHHAMDQELFARPGSQSYEATIVGVGGVAHHTIYNKATFTDASGKVAGLIGAITDITSLKEAEAALRDSEERFRDLTELSSDWYWEQDAEFRVTQISSKIEEFDLDPAEDIGKRRWEFSRLATPEPKWQAHRTDLEAHRPFADFQYERYDMKGSLRTISVSGRPIFGEHGRFLGYRGTGRDVTEQKRAEERIRHMAHYDALTGLPNRALLYDRIAHAIGQSKRSGRPVAVLFLDLDRFKNVNDSLGHAVGDQLLRAVAGRLSACVRSSDTVSRLGGDEFVVVLTDLGQPEDSAQVAQKILVALSRDYEIDTHELHVTPSIGVCIHPQDGLDVETLMRNADAAMYHAKEMGRNNYQFFTTDLNAAAHRRLMLERELRRALDQGEFLMYYQPQVNLETGEILGVEALIRWRHPQRGIVVPGEFIPAAEENGLIDPIGEWALKEACRQVSEWRRAGHPHLRVAVNLSPQQFRRGDLVELVAKTLERESLPPENLVLEITESLIIQRAGQTVERLAALSKLGVQLSVDDFGTGYSSLSYLKRFPIDVLKIDQSFVRDISTDPDDAAIVTAIIAMAHSLSLQVVAEGVETAEQVAFLKRLGCARAQGYYYGRPLPAAEFAQVLQLPVPA